MNRATIVDANYVIPRACMGQIIEVAFAACEDGILRRTTDRSTGRVSYEIAPWSDEVDGEAFEPQNEEPDIPEDCWEDLPFDKPAVPHSEEAAELIRRSASHDEVARAEYTEELHTALVALCDDWTETNDGYDYWGADDSSEHAMSWRVELRRTES